MVGTGYSWLQKYAINAGARNIEDGNIRFMGIGRGALRLSGFRRATRSKKANWTSGGSARRSPTAPS